MNKLRELWQSNDGYMTIAHWLLPYPRLWWVWVNLVVKPRCLVVGTVKHILRRLGILKGHTWNVVEERQLSEEEAEALISKLQDKLKRGEFKTVKIFD